MNSQKYGVILADPPWSYSNRQNGAAEKHYKVMTIQELRMLPVATVAADDAVLVMWATWPQVGHALNLGHSWGFEYKTGFPWVKTSNPPTCDVNGEIVARPAFGIGYWSRGCSEPIFVFTRGKPQLPSVSWLGLISERLEHSRKPDTIYDYCESLKGPYLELFARRQRCKWDVFGNEVENSIQLETQPV